MFAALARRYGGSAISVNLPGAGHVVVISDPVLAKDVFSTSTDLIERPTWGSGTLGDAFGPGSTFSLAGDKLLARRKVVVPLFHGKRVRSYEHIIDDEVMREIATWPEGPSAPPLSDARWSVCEHMCRRPMPPPHPTRAALRACLAGVEAANVYVLLLGAVSDFAIG
jgi:hypothetical protein